MRSERRVIVYIAQKISNYGASSKGEKIRKMYPITVKR